MPDDDPIGKGFALSRWGILAQQARERFQADAPTADSLTEQQWYNVCKFWPTVAERCRRARPAVGKDHPLDATAHLGPIAGALRDVDAEFERAAIRGEHARQNHP